MKTKLTTAAIFSLAASSIAAAQNDECTGAISVPFGAATAFDTTAATSSPELWPCAGSGGSDLWYTVTPTVSGGSVTIDLCGSSYDTALEGFTGTCGALVSVACNDDFCSLQSTMTFGPTTAGTPLVFRIGGFNGASGPGTMTATENPPGMGADECASAVALTAGAATAFDTTGATDSIPAWPCAGGGSDIWFSYTTTMAASRVEVSTCGSSYDTALEIFSGTCAAPLSEACNDDTCGLQSTVLVNSLGLGTTYLIRVGGFGGAQGSGTIVVNELPPPSISQFSGTPPNATAVLDFDNPLVGSGAIASNSPTFTTFGIASVNLVGTWTSAGDAMTVGSNVNGQGLVSDANGVLTVAGPNELLDTPSAGAGFDIRLNAPAGQFGVLFVDQIGFTYTIELLLNGTSYGVETFIYGPANVFPEPGHYWSSSLGVFDQAIILFQNAGGVGIDEIAFDGGMGTLGTPYCMANPNSTGATGALAAMGSPLVVDNDVTLMASDLPLSSFGYFIVSPTQGFVPNPAGSSGNLCLSGATGRYVGPGQIKNTGAAGGFDLTIDLTAVPSPTGFVGTSAGDTWNFQTWHRDAGMSGPTSNFSNGLSITFQ